MACAICAVYKKECPNTSHASGPETNPTKQPGPRGVAARAGGWWAEPGLPCPAPRGCKLVRAGGKGGGTKAMSGCKGLEVGGGFRPPHPPAPLGQHASVIGANWIPPRAPRIPRSRLDNAAGGKGLLAAEPGPSRQALSQATKASSCCKGLSASRAPRPREQGRPDLARFSPQVHPHMSFFVLINLINYKLNFILFLNRIITIQLKDRV